MRNIATINFRDPDADDNGFLIVRASEETVALFVGLEDDGHLETFFGLAVARQLIEALKEAIGE